LQPERYLELIEADGRTLARAGTGDLGRPVPTCPGWSLRDLVGHVGVVHRHKERIVRERLSENPDPEQAPDDELLRTWYDDGLEMLLATLASVPPDTPAITWYPPEQTVGFWQRRMAQETAIHRADAEAASGVVSTLAADLAADGLDEVLGPIMCAYTDDPTYRFSADGRTAVIHLADVGEERTLRLGEGRYGPGWIYEEGNAPTPAASIEGTASDLDLWAWGRGPADALEVHGDRTILDLIRSVASEATQ
jgi:uncharacterized protein (TIGR03083 family)